MGGALSAFWKFINSKRAVRIVMVGLDGAGKTTILYRLKLGDIVETVPTIGFNVETIRYKNVSFTVWDVGGQYKIRALWRYYYSAVDAAIFVVDASDPDRLDECRDEIQYLMKENDLLDASVLIFANKQDIPGALSAKEVAYHLDLLSLKQRQWNVQACSAKTGSNICDGLEWIAHVLQNRNRSQPVPFRYHKSCISSETVDSIVTDEAKIDSAQVVDDKNDRRDGISKRSDQTSSISSPN